MKQFHQFAAEFSVGALLRFACVVSGSSIAGVAAEAATRIPECRRRLDAATRSAATSAKRLRLIFRVVTERPCQCQKALSFSPEAGGCGPYACEDPPFDGRRCDGLAIRPPRLMANSFFSSSDRFSGHRLCSSRNVLGLTGNGEGSHVALACSQPRHPGNRRNQSTARFRAELHHLSTSLGVPRTGAGFSKCRRFHRVKRIVIALTVRFP